MRVLSVTPEFFPLVKTGGLADTGIDANKATAADGVATGFRFAPVTAEALRGATGLFADRAIRRRMVHRAMTREVGWNRAARHHVGLYENLLHSRQGGKP